MAKANGYYPPVLSILYRLKYISVFWICQDNSIHLLDNLIGDKYDRKNIKIYEKQKKLSQKEMAKLINTTQNTLSRYETETTDVNFATIEKIAILVVTKFILKVKIMAKDFKVTN